MSFDSSSETRGPKKNGLGKGLGYALAFVFAFGAFTSGYQVGQSDLSYSQSASVFSFFANKTIAEETTEKPNLDEFWEVWDLLDSKFVTSSTTKVFTQEERIQGAIEGLVDSYGDPYTVYLPPQEATAFDENIAGNFSGVGMEVGLQEGVITVIAPLAGTPAEQAGIFAGDVVVRIDDTSTEGISIDEAVQLIRGDKGTVVTLQIYREGETEFLTIPITRDTINIPTVKTELIDDTFIIALYSFNAVAESQVNDAMREYLESGAEKLIFDVRGNPGGFLQSAVSIASYFLPSGKVVAKEDFGDSEKDDIFRSRGRQIQIFNPKNLVVLVDKGSASAAEILAGALKDHGVATVIGTQTFGKGSVQELVKLDDGSSLKVTVARWLTPNGISISDGGLAPDIIINRTPAQRVAGEDPQKDSAIRFLAGKEVVSETIDDLLDENKPESE